MANLRTVKFQGTIFTPELNIANPLKIANIVAELIPDISDGTPTILPIPQDAPSDVPRIIFNSSDKKLSVNISLQRTNLFYEIPPMDADNEIDIDKYAKISSVFFVGLKKKMDCRVQRIALVTDRIEYREDALEYILNKFCRENQIGNHRPFHNAKRFEIHSHKKYGWEDYNINSWVRLKFLLVKMKDSGEMKSTIFVQNDINTLSIDENPDEDFNKDKIEKFFQKAPGHIREILSLYFE